MTAPEGFKHRTVIPIRYGDMDALGHVNNAKYLTYIEDARVTYVKDLGLWDGLDTEVGLIIARITIDYKLPLVRADGNAEIWTRCIRVGNKSMEVESAILRERDRALAASARVIIVCYDYTVNATVPVPQSWRERMMNYEPGLQN